MVPLPVEWRMNMRTGKVSFRQLDDRICEFPVVNLGYTGRRNRYSYNVSIARNELQRFDGLLKYDLETGKAQSHKYAPGTVGSEAAFAPRIGAVDLTDTYYLDAPELTAAARHEGWLKTGDIGQIDANGILRLVGRSKDMILTGGYNVYPAEVENALVQCKGVSEACAFGVPDDTWGERLEAVVTLAGDAADITVESLRSNVRQAIGPVRTPKRIHVIPSPLPRNAVGKVVRSDIRALIYAPAQQTKRQAE